MTKAELSEILKSVWIPVNEGITEIQKEKQYPRIDYWEYIWEDVMGSGENYCDKNTYQVSFYSRIPKDEKLIELREKFREKGIHLIIYHEFIKEDRIWHSYFSVETLESDE